MFRVNSEKKLYLTLQIFSIIIFEGNTSYLSIIWRFSFTEEVPC
jgi:hypothetical protein